MRKGLTVLLGAIMLTLAVNTSQAEAPVFGTIPDVAIGDAEFNNLTQTFDYNFFVYLNAFDLAEYLTDSDNAISEISVAFKEGPAVEQDDDLEINGVTQLRLPQDSADPSTWTGNVMTTAGATFDMSFRDLIRSPLTHTPDVNNPATWTSPFPAPKLADGTDAGDGDILPWHNTVGSAGVLGPAPDARVVTLFAADADNVVSDGFLVYSIENGSDDLSGGFTTLFTSPPWDQWEWTGPADIGGGISAATSSGGGAAAFLGLEASAAAALGGTNWSRWRTSAVAGGFGFTHVVGAIEPTEIYQARYNMTANTNTGGGPANKTYLATIRMGSLLGGGTIINDFIISGVGLTGFGDLDPHLPALGSSTDFNIFWESHRGKNNGLEDLLEPISGTTGIDGRTWQMYWDVFDVDVAAPGVQKEGLWQLNDLSVGAIAKPAAVPDTAPASQYYLITDLTSGNGFATGPAAPDASRVSVAENTPAAGMITFNDLGTGTAAAYLLWERVAAAADPMADLMSWQAGQIIRVTANLSCPTSTDRLNFHNTRIRNQTTYAHINSVMTILQNQQALPNGGSNPGCPVARDGNDALFTPYEVYLPSFGGPGTDLLTNFPDGRLWSIFIDQIVAAGGGAPVASQPTAVTVHQMLLESLAEPPSIP